MNLKTSLRGWLRRGRLLVLLIIVAPSAEAVNQEIRALFTPDPANPQRNEFINKTPESGYCAYYPDICRRSNTFSLRLMTRFESNGAMQADADPRNSAMFKVPGNWRQLTVTNATRDSATVEVRIAGISSNYVLSDTAASLTGASNAREGHDALWRGSGWLYAAPPCQSTGVGFFGESTYAFFWKTPDETPCVKTARFAIPGMSYSYLDFAYELRTPNPLGMPSGLYTGSLSYSLGPSGDFDFGDIMIPNDPDLTLDFVLDVQHTLKVDIPPGGEKVQLVPAGGWQSWLQAGRRPVSLFRDQTFNISASTRFRMSLECEIPQLFNCMIRDPVSQRTAVVQVFVSLPNGLTDLAGRPVRRQPLRIGFGEANQVFQPGFYVDRAPGVLHFEMSPHYVNEIVRAGESARYRGNITVIWDSEV
ncbi:hypothetical protein [Pseudomonas baetica]|uniref:hypothetical protein n=1 Tax=Pseudomonas baetica TaxID=674054 RepID=UPI0024068C0F|nr:hypothetical protein [Pseudomonas baetica]MDF9777065.1 hypothetical protein [Pseudomonas baetica]